MVKTVPSNTRGACLIPGQRTKIPHALGPKNMKQKQYCNRFNNGHFLKDKGPVSNPL